MSLSEIRKSRLYNQQIATSQCKSAAEVVSWLVAMQAQEFRHAKWAIGLRLNTATEEDVDNAFNSGAILRTHLMRPTWHFVAPEDIRWLLALTAPRVHSGNAPYYKKLELSKTLFTRCLNIITRSLEGGKYLKRSEVQEIFKQKKINAEGMRLAYIMMHAELEGLICSGPRIGKQFSYALLEERIPKAKSYSRDEALCMFLLRYFNSRGPATLNDFAYWSGLTLKDARVGFEAIRTQLQKIIIDGKEYFTGNITVPKKLDGQDTFLMPDYDEYGMSYKDRSALRAIHKEKMPQQHNWSVFGHYIVVEGTMQGTWRDEVFNDSIKVSSKFITPLTGAAKRKVNNALKRYSSFFGKKLQHDVKTSDHDH
ncbi:MAG TPA: winged helix DNA-binding domain-containing protein [Chryseolinea sp.]|nr:winged helix DNA-binding domain-containing protein [Chryseolinea sp.]